MTSTRLSQSRPPSHASDSASTDKNVSSEGVPVPRRLTTLRVAWLVIGTVLCLLALGAVDFFALFNARALQGEERTRMQPMHLEPAFIDVSVGEKLHESLSLVPPLDGARARMLFLGNSQQYSASLPRGGVVDESHRPSILSSLFEQSLEAQDPGRWAIYNGSAPNQNYAEALWQALWWFEVGGQPPRALVLQASFDSFRKTGIRAGYQTLLEEPRFRAVVVSHLEAEPRAYAADYLFAMQERDQRLAELAGAASEKGDWKQWSPEPALREAMERVPAFAHRFDRKVSFLATLYNLRVLTFRITPTTRRHIAGPPLEQSFAALADLIAEAKRHHAQVLVYNAPVNPAVDMFYPEEYAAYLKRLRALCSAENLVFTDLAETVPRELWGYWIDGPDPIHFNQEGHRIVNASLEREFLPSLVGGR